MDERSRTFSLRKLPLKLMQVVIVSAFLLVNCLPAMAQTGVRVSGVVTSDADGMPLIGVNVVQRGTTNGTVTDFDGKFELTVPVNSQLDFSYIGYINQQITVSAGRNQYNVVLKEDSQSLDEVVVVGYGVQKKKLVTGATVQVGGDDIKKLSTTSVLGALQSQTPGVNITQSSGQPGEGFKVNIRGIGTIGDSSPLYVVDGVSGGDINLINPSDIESIDVLKDAASAAIYGSRGANGVILITTKKGKAGKVQLSYDGFWGVQNVYRMPDLLTAKEYMAIQDETRYNEGNGTYDWSSIIPKYILDKVEAGWEGTNWVDEFRNKNAVTQNHAIALTGGSDVSKFSMGLSYSSQEGIFGKPQAPHFDRYTARLNSEHVLLKGKGYDIVTIGENLLFSHHTKTGQGIGDMYWNDLHNMLVGNPLLPVYNSEGDYYMQSDKVDEGWLLQGSIGNPLADYALSSRRYNYSRNFQLRSSAFIDIQPIKNLRFRSLFGYNRNSGSYRSYNGARHISSTTNVTMDEIGQSGWAGYDISWTNTLNYIFTIDQQHSFDVLLGHEMLKSGMGEGNNATVRRSRFPGSFKHAYLTNTTPTTFDDYKEVKGAPWAMGRAVSFFGRASYNFKETYMATVTFRADGSSQFARGNRWGYFPSVSAGWVITNENFMESLRDGGLDFFKLRASWGQNGNNRIDAFQYLSTVAMDGKNAYYFGESKETPTQGAYADILPNPDVTWETSETIDVGFDAMFLNSRLGVNFDWYQRNTKDWLVKAPMLSSYGTGAPFINGGDIRNQGVELALNWNDRIGSDFYYGVNFNVAYNKNEVTRIANSEEIIHGPGNILSQGTTEMYRVEVGKPIGYFWGYKTAGVFQNQAEVDAYRASGKGILDTAQPGDLIFVDTDDNGVITDADKVMIGDPRPDWTGGLTLTLGYKGFDFGMTAVGMFGHQIAKSYRSFADSPLNQYTTDIFGRWHGEGTSNKLPRLTSGSHTNWQYISDIYIEDADFVRMQNITLGYDFKKLFPNMPLGQARIYVTAQNLFTITGYSGMDPEVGASANDDYKWGSGVDLGFYPSPRTYLIGVNLKF
ncbi:TonB-linked SusC/RagA family outer membrane protein [Parabacteroides sp. PF5-5]|uniref:SusC/RagA family TonB-linked outer membrane protein n=1 Tax=unclassified Parabacteroides TaxID=2649774 RepID=UPI0024743A7D|nr:MULTISPECIES: TonB-dependent receptor [unclassified Parabacteroides]MDH6304495.1 TonB-linked SusC/RagA family outer membrane protein [Parabacteroides sp. PH5-39]MDH6315352.1 TonB-linked SusC/RagA family outer membrane protein [Parabacteroides sp. PF5-13]MDH6319154.1 TonB-linked SusC/RagA family outer membrane protein [Parabacteroides sp. PH5-13]MDH6322884.1 TonB-linked SusC/RagA family outer membrane protein [Parabacteroides sp. PH5-8]MDH6326544.1 TonB-linked SusC/RagA family outer membrane